MTHKLSEPYSGKNPIPKVTTGLRSLINPQKATEAKAQQLQAQQPSAEKEQDEQKKEDEKQDERQTEKQMKKGRNVRVRDPTTGEDVDVRNAPQEVPEDEKGENVLKLPLPEPGTVLHVSRLAASSLTCSGRLGCSPRRRAQNWPRVDPHPRRNIHLLLLLPLPFSYRHTFSIAFMLIYPLLASAPALLTTLVLTNRLRGTALDSASARAWHAERTRGVRAGADANGDGQISADERTRESAEWANALLAGVWPIMNPALFASLVDMIEDIMQGSVPSFVHSVRISDLGLGWNPMRITSVRALPDADTEEALDTLDSDLRDQLGGEHVNLEVSFSYSAVPSGQNAREKARNAHLLIDFFLSLKGVWGFSVPVWVEVTGVVGTARLRLQLIPDPPFVKTTLFTLLGLPRTSITVVALSRALPNVMNFPFISGFISSSLDTAAAEYIAPKSLVLDVQRLIGSGDVNKDTQAIGVLIVHIHRAWGIKKMDTTGSSDPYVTLTYSRLGKPLFSTRIIKNELNPVWEEMAVLPLDVNIVKLKEKLSVQLWDSDRGSADDMMGTVEIDVLELMRNKDQVSRHVAPLSGHHDTGRAEYTAGYFGKRAPDAARPTDGRDPGLPPDLQLPSSEQEQEQRSALDDVEEAVLRCPPDSEWLSGLLCVQVHEIRDLGMGRGGRRGTEGSRGLVHEARMKMGGAEEDERDQDEQGESEEAEGMPSSYCTISLNDELVYKTRVKPITSSPIFNAGTERFVRDWRSAHVSIAVKDSGLHENDAILGIVLLKLSDLLVNASQLTRVYHLEHSIGYGRIRISVLFRPVSAKFPPQLRGFEIGTLRVHDVRVRVRVEPAHHRDLAKAGVKIKTTTGTDEEKLPQKPDAADEGGEIAWARDGGAELPVRERYATALALAFKSSGMASNTHAMAVLWLRDIADTEPTSVELALFAASDESAFAKLKQNYVSPSGDLSALEGDGQGALGLTRVGSAVVCVEFVPGIGAKHRGMLGTGGAGRWEEVQREAREGGREGVCEVPDERKRPHQDTASSPKRVGTQDGAGQYDQEGSPIDGQGNVRDVGGRDSEQAAPEREGYTTVPHDYAEVESGRDGDDEGDDDEGDDEQHGKKKKRTKSPIKKFKEWKEKERELHADHRGIMQTKGARTAVWMKDNVHDAAHSVKDRFKMEGRQPDVETEV